MVPRTMIEAYDEAQKFVNLESELKLLKKENLTTSTIVKGKEKKGFESQEAQANGVP